MLGIGSDRFIELLDGAYVMDCHFADTDFNRNIPVLMGLRGSGTELSGAHLTG